MPYKLSLLVSILFFANPLLAQKQKYQTNNAKIVLDVLAELQKIEPGETKKPNKIKLITQNDEGTSELDPKNGQIQFSVPVKSFKFEKADIQKSFQASSILKSKQYPFVIFKGRIVNYKKRILRKKKETAITVEGDLTIRGVTKPIKVTGTLARVGKDQLAGKARFTIPDASVFASNGEEQEGLTEEVKVSVDAQVEVVYQMKTKD